MSLLDSSRLFFCCPRNPSVLVKPRGLSGVCLSWLNDWVFGLISSTVGAAFLMTFYVS